MILNITLIVLSFFALVLPSWNMIFKKRQITKLGMWLMAVGLFLLILSILKACKDKKAEDVHAAKIEAISTSAKNCETNTEKLIVEHKQDSSDMAEFLKRLQKQFEIVRDSLTNQPKKIVNKDTYNTSIRDVENLHIGPKN